MFKKTITFEDLDGNSVTEDFYFNLSKTEIARLELSTDGGFSEKLIKIIDSKHGGEIIKTFEDMVTLSYGIRGEDNKTFRKSAEISDAFMQTDAYNVLFMELVTDAEASAAFVNGIIPAGLQANQDPDKPSGPRLVSNVEAAKTIQDIALPQVAALSPSIREMTLDEMRAAINASQAVPPVTP